LVNNIWKAER